MDPEHESVHHDMEALQGVELEYSGIDMKFNGLVALHGHSLTCWQCQWV